MLSTIEEVFSIAESQVSDVLSAHFATTACCLMYFCLFFVIVAYYSPQRFESGVICELQQCLIS